MKRRDQGVGRRRRKKQGCFFCRRRPLSLVHRDTLNWGKEADSESRRVLVAISGLPRRQRCRDMHTGADDGQGGCVESWRVNPKATPKQVRQKSRLALASRNNVLASFPLCSLEKSKQGRRATWTGEYEDLLESGVLGCAAGRP